jgi:molybdopterin converting factor small subunit
MVSHLALAFLPPVRANAAMADARILFLGRLAEIAGGRERALPLGGSATVSEIVEALGRDDPELAAALAAPSVRVAVNQQIQRGRDGRAGPGDEIAFLPPVSGG